MKAPAGGKPAARKAYLQRSWETRRPKNVIKTVTKPAVMPGSQGYMYSSGTPPVRGAAEQWIKSVFDAAHTRSYGCIGVPDNNRMPTVVQSRRKEYEVSTYKFPQSSLVMGFSTNANVSLVKSTEADFVFGDSTPITRFMLFSHPCIGHMWYAHVPAGLAASSGGTQKYYHFFGVLADNYPPGSQARPINCAHVMENVGAWSDMGGYFTGAHIPIQYRNLDTDYGEEVRIDGSDYDSYITYQGGSGAGVYNMCRMRNLDAATFFADSNVTQITLALPGLSIDTQRFENFDSTYLKQVNTAWDCAASKYTSTTTNFVIRITTYSAYEVITPYANGGSDGARYDRAALEFVMATLDNADFIFPADHNDSAKLARKVKQILKKYKPAILAAMGVAGAPQWLKGATKGLIAGLETES